MDYEVKLDIFEGPLDLLLYLIKKNEIDIYDVPIALITEQYLKYMEMLKSLNLDLAGEYLVLASTLIHIKSRLLLPDPAPGEDEEETDPRTDLVQQLLEYQTYKEAALALDGRPQLERDVFKRGSGVSEAASHALEEEDVLVEASLFDLIDAFQRMMIKLTPAQLLEIESEKISLAEKITEITERLRREQSLTFTDLLEKQKSRRQMIYTFLAILELIKMQIVKAYQSASFGSIRLFLKGETGHE
jgi:segregation and condensation protein A